MLLVKTMFGQMTVILPDKKGADTMMPFRFYPGGRSSAFSAEKITGCGS